MSEMKKKDKFGFLRLPESGMTTYAPDSKETKFGWLTFKCSLDDLKYAGFNHTFADFAVSSDDPDDILITFNCNPSGYFASVWLTASFGGEPKQCFTNGINLFYPEAEARRQDLFEVQSALAETWRSRKEFYVPCLEPKAEPGEFENYKEAAAWAKEWKRKHPGKECPVRCDFDWNVWIKPKNLNAYSSLSDVAAMKGFKAAKTDLIAGQTARLFPSFQARGLAKEFSEKDFSFFMDNPDRKFDKEIPFDSMVRGGSKRLWAVARKSGGKAGPENREAVRLCFSAEAARVHAEWREAKNEQEWENYNKDKKGNRGNEPEDPEDSEWEVFELSGKSQIARRLVAEGKWNSEPAEHRREVEKKIVAPFVSDLKEKMKEISERASLSAEEKVAAVHNLTESELEKISFSETDGRKLFEKKAMKAAAEAFEEIEGGLVLVLAERTSAAMKSLNAKRTSETVLAFAKAGLEGFSKPEAAMLNAALGRKGVLDEKSLCSVLKKEIAKVERNRAQGRGTEGRGM